MSKGDLALWTGLITIVSIFAICFAVAAHRSFCRRGPEIRVPGTADRNEFETFWRGRR